MGIDCFGLTDPGLCRDHNQDQFLIAELGRALVVHQSSLGAEAHGTLRGRAHAQVFAVADGVGGGSDGALASQLAVRALVSYSLELFPWCVRLDPREEDDLTEELGRALARCRAALASAAACDPERADLATTLTLALVIWPQVWILNVGDSRAYLAHDGGLTQLTRDQTVAEELAQAGLLTRSGVLRSRWRHVLSNTVGAGVSAAPEVTRLQLSIGDALLLCTDGLTKHVGPEALREHLVGAPSAEDACQGLVAAANADGGTDNVTCVVARFFDPTLADVDTVRLRAS